MRTRIGVVSIVLLALLVVVYSRESPSLTTLNNDIPGGASSVFGEADIAELVAAADSKWQAIEFDTRAEIILPGDDDGRLFAGWFQIPPADYPVIAGPTDIPAIQVARLRDVLFRSSNYEVPPGPPKTCRPYPTVGLRVSRGSRVIDLLVCFGCRELATCEGEKWIQTVGFETHHAEVVNVFKDIFPTSEVIQQR